MKTKTKIRAYILRSAAAALLISCVIVALSSGNGISNSAAGIVAGGGATVAISNSTLSGNSGDAIYNDDAVHFGPVPGESSANENTSDLGTLMLPLQPLIGTTNPATFIASFSATLDGSLNSDGLTTTFHFQYGKTTAYGLTTAPQTQTGNTSRNVAAKISSLTANTTYHFRIVASNADGTRMGSDRTFTTLTMTGPPVFITEPASNITESAATLNGALDPLEQAENCLIRFAKLAIIARF